MTKKAMYFIDLDGTLLNDHQFPSYHNTLAVIEARKYVDTTIATGRNFTKKVREIGELLNISNFICMNGAVIVANNEILAHYPLELAEQEKILEQIKSRFCILYIFNRFNVTTYKSRNYFNFGPFRKRLLKIKRVNTYKISLFHLSKKQAAKNFAFLKTLNLNVELALSFHNHSIEITDQNANKGKAAAFLMHHFHSDGEKSIHIGDSLNDLSMKGVVGKLIALKNASQGLKDEADIIGPHYKEDGVAQVLEAHLLELKATTFTQEHQALKKQSAKEK